MSEMISHVCEGGCHCGNIRFSARLSFNPELFHPRVCDCNFCRLHAAAYLSDPGGKVSVFVKNGQEILHSRQGSEQAVFLSCVTCRVLVAVYHDDDGRIYGAINVRSVDKTISFGEEQIVSPKLLGDEEKLLRWKKAWFPDISITIENTR